MWPFTKLPEDDKPKHSEACDPFNWEVMDCNTIGTAQCRGCGQTLPINILLNAWKKAMEEEMRGK